MWINIILIKYIYFPFFKCDGTFFQPNIYIKFRHFNVIFENKTVLKFTYEHKINNKMSFLTG